jgi:hypothetical protein
VGIVIYEKGSAGNQSLVSIVRDPVHRHAERGIRHARANRVTGTRAEEQRIELADGNADTQEALVLVGSDVDVTGYESRVISYRCD